MCKATKAETLRAARQLLKQMKGKGWKIEVWENLGWYYSVSNGPITVFVDEDSVVPYSCLMTTDPHFPGTGETYWQPARHFSEPNEAVRHQLKVAQEFVDKCCWQFLRFG